MLHKHSKQRRGSGKAAVTLFHMGSFILKSQNKQKKKKKKNSELQKVSSLEVSLLYSQQEKR